MALSDNFLQYYLGAYVYNDDAGTTENGKLHDVVGADNPFTSLSWSFGGPSGNNQDHSRSFIATSGILPAATYPQFTSSASAKYYTPLSFNQASTKSATSFQPVCPMIK